LRKISGSTFIGSGGWTFGSHSGPSNHRLRVESFDQSQGYEPCGLNLATPPRYKREAVLTGFKGFNSNLRRAAENPLLANIRWKCFSASNPALSGADELLEEERR